MYRVVLCSHNQAGVELMFNFFCSELLDFIECEEEYQPGDIEPTEEKAAAVQDLHQASDANDRVNITEDLKPTHLTLVQ